MKIRLTSMYVDDQEKVLRFYDWGRTRTAPRTEPSDEPQVEPVSEWARYGRCSQANRSACCREQGRDSETDVRAQDRVT
jgi:hypothetical protein